MNRLSSRLKRTLNWTRIVSTKTCTVGLYPFPKPRLCRIPQHQGKLVWIKMRTSWVNKVNLVLTLECLQNYIAKKQMTPSLRLRFWPWLHLFKLCKALMKMMAMLLLLNLVSKPWLELLKILPQWTNIRILKLNKIWVMELGSEISKVKTPTTIS
jgi:hypothetical protein